MADEPSPWLVQNVDLIPPGRRVLDVACGKGRHAVFLAGLGWAVHAVDRDRDALAHLVTRAGPLGASITTEALDLEAAAVRLGSRCYGAVIVFNYLHRPLMPSLVEAVEAGGVLIYETFTVGQARRGHPRNPLYLLEEGELATLVAPLEVLRCWEGERDGQLLSSIVARRG